MKTHDKIYIGGAWVPSKGEGSIEVISASTEEVIGTIPAGHKDDVDAAVAAAQAAFPSWSQTSVEERVEWLQKMIGGLHERQGEIAEAITGELGMPLGMSKAIQAGLPLATASAIVDVLKTYKFEEQVGHSLIVREPIGVVGCITPWNFPLHQIVLKVAPAIAAGCPVVLKPSEVAPLNAFILAEIFDAIGLPAGVFNLVSGDGPTVGEAIAAHPGIEFVSFTGSTRAGKRVSEVAAANIKRVALELGGKSPNIIMADAQFEKAVRAGVNSVYLNSGQACNAPTRMLVPAAKRDDAVRIAKEQAEGFTVGDPFDKATKLGPLISKVQQDRVRGYIEKGVEEGATLVTGGPEMPEGVNRGYYVRPTVFADVTNDMTIAQEEIFGPVLSILTYEDEEDAIKIANDTVYGLAAYVWADTVEDAQRVARRLRAGQVDVNGGGYNPAAPFGGYKQSGTGREGGLFGFEEYLEIKSMQIAAE